MKTQPQLGRTLQDRIMAKEEDLPPQDNGRTKATAPLEHGASTEILPVEKI